MNTVQLQEYTEDTQKYTEVSCILIHKDQKEKLKKQIHLSVNHKE